MSIRFLPTGNAVPGCPPPPDGSLASVTAFLPAKAHGDGMGPCLECSRPAWDVQIGTPLGPMEAPGRLYPLIGRPDALPSRGMRDWALLGLAALLGLLLGLGAFAAVRLRAASRAAAPFLAVGGRVTDGWDLIGRLGGREGLHGVFLA